MLIQIFYQLLLNFKIYFLQLDNLLYNTATMNKLKRKSYSNQRKVVQKTSVAKIPNNSGIYSYSHSRKVSKQKICSPRVQNPYQTLNLTLKQDKLDSIIPQRKCHSRASKHYDHLQRKTPIVSENKKGQKQDKYSLLQIQYQGLLRKYYNLQNQVIQTTNHNIFPHKYENKMLNDENLRLKEELREIYLKLQSFQTKNMADQQYIRSLEGGRANDIEQTKNTVRIVSQNRLLGQQVIKLKQSKLLLSKQKKQLETQLHNCKQKYANQQHLLKSLRIEVERNLSQRQVDKKLQVQLQQTNQQKLLQIRKQQQTIKTLKKQLQLSKGQSQQLKDSFEIQLVKIDKNLMSKDNTIRQLRKQIQQLRQNIDVLNQQKNEEIKVLTEKKRKVEKQLTSSVQQIGQLKSKIAMKQTQIQHLNKQYKQLHYKYSNKTEQVDAERKQKQQAFNATSEARKQLTKAKVAKSQVQKQLHAQKDNYQILHNKFKSKDEELSLLREQIEKLEGKLENITKQVGHYRTQCTQIKAQCQQQCRITEQLRIANLECQRNEDEFSKQLKEYQRRIEDYQCEQNAYTSRYEALVARNEQLDERNRQLSSMVNQAIQLQVDGYKKGILKSIEINANQLVQSIEQQQHYSQQSKRVRQNSQHSRNQIMLLQTPQKQGQSEKSQEKSSLLKMANQKITDHKNKVSQSAKKLSQILDMKSPVSREARNKDKQQDIEEYQQLNHKMNRYSNDKHQVMKKINSFAEKLKIL